MTGSQWLTATAPGYTTRVTVVDTGALTEWTQILRSNPQRWWVYFIGSAGGVNCAWVLPGDAQPTAPTNQSMPCPQSFQFDHCPSVVQGPWWTSGGLGNSLVVIECLYTGE